MTFFEMLFTQKTSALGRWSASSVKEVRARESLIAHLE
jgi:hypothetical protein